MRIKGRIAYPVCIVLDAIRFFALAALGSALLELSPDRIAGASLFRFLLLPQLIPACLMVFLWLDLERFREYRPLAILVKASSLPFLALTAFAAFGDREGLPIALGAFAASLAPIVLVDLVCLAVLALSSIPAPKAEPAPVAASLVPESVAIDGAEGPDEPAG